VLRHEFGRHCGHPTTKQRYYAFVLKVLLIVIPALLVAAAPLCAGSIEGRFVIDKAAYVTGEPIFVSLMVTNNGSKPVWLDFKAPDTGVFSACNDFAVEVKGAEPPEQWGCGEAGSCGRGLRNVEAGESITLRRLLNFAFRFRRIGSYSIHARTTIVIRGRDLFDASVSDQVDVDETLSMEVKRGDESQLRAVFQSFIADLKSTGYMRQSDAASAITELAPPFLENVLIELTKTKYAGAAMSALRKIDTPRAQEVLVQIAATDGETSVRVAAIQNLGRTSGVIHLPVLFQLLQSKDREIRRAAAASAGKLGRAASIPQLVMLLSDADPDARQAGADGLGNTHAREAVRPLIALLLDSEASVRQEAVGSLFLLTQHAAFEPDSWSEVDTMQEALAVHRRWVRWWDANASGSVMHGLGDCAAPSGID
jgi:hypothetical protein